jgi:hypothetical protein
MAQTQRWQAIPTQLELAEFEQFVLPHLSIGSRGPAPKLSLYKIFNYVLKILYLGCQCKELPIDKDGEGWQCYRILAQECWPILAHPPSLNLRLSRSDRGAFCGLESQSGIV